MFVRSRVAPPVVITHGSQLTTANTGYGAYFDPALGRKVLLSDLTSTSGSVSASDFVSSGGVITKRRFTGDFTFDINNVTVRACLFDNPVSSFNGTHHTGSLLDYCTVSPASVGDECMHYESWSANRCYFRGCSDGAKINGGASAQTLTECLIQVKMQSPDDHNDGLQNVGGNGAVNIRRCNLSVNPEGGLLGGGSGGPDAVILSADMTAGSVFRLEVTDSLLDGTNSVETLRLYDGGLTSNITYLATGNLFVRSASAPVGRGSSNTTPTGQITWSNNRWADDLSSISLT